MRRRRTPPLRPLCAALTLAPAPGPQELALGFSASHVASRTRTSPLCPPRAPLLPPRAPSGTCPDALTLPAQHMAALGTERAPERERPPVVASPRGTDGHPPRTEQSGWRGSVPPTAGLLWSSLYARTAPDSAASAKASTTGTGTPHHAAPPAPHHAPTRRLRSPGDPQLRRAQALRRAAALVRPRLATSRGRCTAISTRPAWQGAQGHCWWHRLARAEGAARCGQRFHFVFSCHCLCLTRVEPGLLSRAPAASAGKSERARRACGGSFPRPATGGVRTARTASGAPAGPRPGRPGGRAPPASCRPAHLRAGRPQTRQGRAGPGPTLLKRTRSFYKE